jgi:hypothetical protein
MSFRTALIAIALTLGPATPAAAAEVSLTVAPPQGVRLGNATAISGRVTEVGAPLANRVVRLEVRRHPFKAPWKLKASATTTADGRYAFAPKLDRNHRVRVRVEAPPPSSPYILPEPDALSPRRDAFVLPAFTLSFDQRGTRVLRLRQTYTVPRDVKLSAPTRFYVGPCRRAASGACTARRAEFRAAAETRRVRAGRYVARASVRIPKSFHGEFQYASCFRYSPGSGMGDPNQRCPRRFARLR